MNEYKNMLRNNLFEKYFEGKDYVLLSEIIESTSEITTTWNFLHQILENCIEDYDKWSRLENIKEIEYKNKKYLIIKVMIHKYIVIDLETKKILGEEEALNKFEEQLFIDNFNERKIGEKMYNRIYWFLNGNNANQIIDYYNQNKRILSYPTKIFYKINMDDVYTFLSIRLNDNIQLSFHGKDQILYETLFMNCDLTPCGVQDTKDRIGIEKMREMFDRIPNIKIPREYIPKEFFEDGLIREKNNILIKK